MHGQGVIPNVMQRHESSVQPCCRQRDVIAESLGRPLPANAHSPLKTLMNLTTAVDSLVFSPDTQACTHRAVPLCHLFSLTC